MLLQTIYIEVLRMFICYYSFFTIQVSLRIRGIIFWFLS